MVVVLGVRRWNTRSRREGGGGEWVSCQESRRRLLALEAELRGILERPLRMIVRIDTGKDHHHHLMVRW
jgi:hypothetical protein